MENLRGKIEQLLEEKGKISTMAMAKELGVSQHEIFKNYSDCREYPVEKIDELFTILRTWEKVFLLVVTQNFVLEIQDRFPEGFYGHGFLNFHDKKSSIGGHLTVSNIKEIFFVKDIMFGRESCSIKFLDENKKEIFAVYVPRDEKKEFIKSCIESFNSIV